MNDLNEEELEQIVENDHFGYCCEIVISEKILTPELMAIIRATEFANQLAS